ncbi:1-phosphofructokinase [Halalkalibacillus halophilus]|uniref:1-phosphofructokinase n=1 Tax=Halalkalibacillus halophilus TaxID=392827 RepID=UPI000421D435|nr:1-phosphofructokinase [Halalkalibacillus halophilus]
MKQALTITLNPAIDKTIYVPKLNLGSLNRLEQPAHSDPGGKGINVAKVLRQLKQPVYTTGLIAGENGEKLVKDLQQLGIDTSFYEVDGEVRTNLKIVDQSTCETTEINEPGFYVSKNNEQAFSDNVDQLLDHTSFFALGGSTPSGMENTIYKKLITMANNKGVKCILDASGTALREGIQAKPFAIKPNIHELEDLFETTFKSEQEIVQKCKELIHGGIELVVVSLGSKGALFVSGEEAYQTKPFDIQVGSTVGAGDSMVGAMIYSLDHDFTLKEIAKWATAAGTITASKPGTNVCTIDEIKESVNKIEVTNI